MLAKSRLLPLRSLLPNGQKPKLLREPAYNAKTKAPQTLSSQGTPLSNNPPRKLLTTTRRSAPHWRRRNPICYPKFTHLDDTRAHSEKNSSPSSPASPSHFE